MKTKKIPDFRTVGEAVAFLEKERKKTLFLFVLFIVLAALFGTAAFPLLLIGAIHDFDPSYLKGIFVGLGFLSFFVLMTPFIFLAIHQKNGYRKLFSDILAPHFAKEKYEEFRLDFRKDLSDIGKTITAKPVKKPDSDEAFYCEGKAQGRPFRTYSFSYLIPGKGHPDTSYGRYVEFTLPQASPAEVRILPKHSALLFPKETLPFSLPSESIRFDHDYEAQASSKVEGMIVLSPVLINGICFLADGYQGKLSLWFKGNQAMIYLDHRGTHFELSLGKKVTPDYLKGFEEEILLPYRVGEELGLFQDR
jgi:hypothetical protein